MIVSDPVTAPPSTADRRAIERDALALLRHNRRSTRHPHDGQRRRYTCPSPGHYPFQWFWDSCFHAVALAHLEPEVAREELELLVSWQARSGFLAHVLFWERRRLASPGLYWTWLQSRRVGVPRRSALIQPPVIAAALESYHAVTGDGALVRRLLPSLDRYFDYLGRVRCPDDSPLLAIVAPWESGMDHRPSYDGALGLGYPASPRGLVLRPRRLDVSNRVRFHHPPLLHRRRRFLVQDVLMNAVYADGLRTLGALHDRVGEGSGEVWQQRAAAVERAMTTSLRGEDGFFYDRDLRSDRLLPVRTVAGLMPLLCDSLSDAELAPLYAALDRPDQFATPYAVPSVAVGELAFVPGELRWGAGPLIWRGPTWINTNWLLWRALRRRRLEARAAGLVAASAALVLRSGFREYYHPFTGEGLGARSFGWSTLLVDMLARAA